MKTKKAPDSWDKLESFIKAQAESIRPKQSDEFTLLEYIGRMQGEGVEVSITTAKEHMQRLLNANKIAKRQLVIKGSKTNLFRFL
jgi:hypothetical protein